MAQNVLHIKKASENPENTQFHKNKNKQKKTAPVPILGWNHDYLHIFYNDVLISTLKPNFAGKN